MKPPEEIWKKIIFDYNLPRYYLKVNLEVFFIHHLALNKFLWGSDSTFQTLMIEGGWLMGTKKKWLLWAWFSTLQIFMMELSMMILWLWIRYSVESLNLEVTPSATKFFKRSYILPDYKHHRMLCLALPLLHSHISLV